MTYPNTVISMPSQLFTMRTSFKAMANGNVYVGAVDTDPTIPTNQIQVYIEQENGTLVPVAQPIKINSAGLLTYSGQVQKFVLTNTEYSMAVLNAYGVQEHYFPRVYDQGISAALEVEGRLSGGDVYKGANGQYVTDGDLLSTYNKNITILHSDELLNLIAWDEQVSNSTISSISENSYSGFNVVLNNSEIIEYTTIETRRKRGQQETKTSIDFDISAIGFGFPLDKDSTSVDSADFVNKAMNYASLNRGGTVLIPSSVTRSDSNKITVLPGCELSGPGVPQTFDNFRTSATILTDGGITESDGITSAPVIEIGEGTDDTSKRNRGMHVKGVKVLGPSGTQLGIGFSSVNTNYADFTQSAFNFRMTDNVAENMLLGFRYRNSWNLEISKNIAIRCDVGHRYDGDVSSGGTSSVFSANLSYLCRVGHDFQATGWTYTEVVGCGSDGCEIGARFTGASYRGFSLKNFGFENIDTTNGTAYGIYVDNGSSGILDIDGLLCGVHDDPDAVFIGILSCQRVSIRNSDVGSSVVGSGKILWLPSPSNVGRVTIKDCDWFGSDVADNIGDVFLKEVTLINTRINNRLYHNATGGMDAYPHRVKYTSSSTDYEGVNRPSKQIHSIEMLCDTNTDASNRFISGVPAFDTSQIPDGAIIEFVNATNISNPAQIGIRSEDHTAGTGVVRDSAINAATTIILANPGDRAKFQKRSDGKLYQLTIELAGV